MARVECLASRAVHVEIDESNLRGQLKVCDFVEYGRADIARTDDDDFSPIDGHNNDLLEMQKAKTRRYALGRYGHTMSCVEASHFMIDCTSFQQSGSAGFPAPS